MPRESKIPKFKNEDEEAAWYTTPAGLRETTRDFKRAIKDGTLIRGLPPGIRTDPAVLERLMQEARERMTKAISLRISVADLERAKAVAEQEGISYQAVLKRAISAGLAPTPPKKARKPASGR